VIDHHDTETKKESPEQSHSGLPESVEEAQEELERWLREQQGNV